MNAFLQERKNIEIKKINSLTFHSIKKTRGDTSTGDPPAVLPVGTRTRVPPDFDAPAYSASRFILF